MALGCTPGARIRLFQSLYMQYSRLGFTRPSDRPFAIAGLEKRLVQSLGVCGGLGVLDDRRSAELLRRFLLWRRAEDCDTLEAIRFDRSQRKGAGMPPSWSWMGFSGAIEYLDLPLGQVAWREEELVSPWLGSEPGTWYSSDCAANAVSLPVVVRDLDVSELLFMPMQMAYGGSIVLDVPTAHLPGGVELALKCIVLGELKYLPQAYSQPETHAVLIVRSESQSTRGEQIYRRIGIGFVPGNWISHERGSSGILL